MIESLILKNFKCFDSLELEMKPLTLITGINGMGKSSVIQSLLLLRQSFDTKFLEAQGKVLLNGELVKLVNGNAIRYALSDSPITSIILDLSNEKKFIANIDAGSKDENLKCNYESTQDLKSIPVFEDGFVYLSAERLGPRIEYFKSQSNNHKGRLGTGGGELTASFLFQCLREQTILPIKRLRHPNAKSDLIYQNVSAWLSEITFDGAQITASEKSPDILELSYSFNKGKFKGNDFSPVNVGFGFSFVLPVILAVLSAKPGSLICIENPEAHLHPSAQSKIGKLLALAAENEVQIVIETHSDHLLNGIRVLVKGDESLGTVNSDNIIVHYFAAEYEDGTETRYKEKMQIYPDGKMDDWPPGFFDEWENNLKKIVF
jgi:predicted ATPase